MCKRSHVDLPGGGRFGGGQVPLNVCEWFSDYKPVTTGRAEVEYAYE